MFTEDFSEDHLNSDTRAFMWGNDPFVVTVFCKESGQGFLTDWWVSGRRWKDDSPILVLKLRLGVTATREDLKATLFTLWENNLKDVSFGSAIFGGIQNPSTDLKELSDQQKAELFDFHLQGHSQYGHFNIKGSSKVERTATMYLLLKSLGSKQPQKAIAKFESVPFISEIKSSAINQRLALARQQGYLTKELEQTFSQESKEDSHGETL
jgi:hypothetical protein